MDTRDPRSNVDRRNLVTRLFRGLAALVIIPLAEKILGSKGAFARTPMDQIREKYGHEIELDVKDKHIDDILKRKGTEDRGDSEQKPIKVAYNRFGRAYNRFGRAYNRFAR
jgi:hypothetical protein